MTFLNGTYAAFFSLFSLGNRNGNNEVPDLSGVPGGEEMAGLWAQYHSALGLAKGKATPPATRDQSVSKNNLLKNVIENFSVKIP